MKAKIPIDIIRLIYQYLYADVKHELLNKVSKDETCYTTQDKVNSIIDFCLEYEKNFKPEDNSAVLVIYEKNALQLISSLGWDTRSLRGNHLILHQVEGLLLKTNIDFYLIDVWGDRITPNPEPTNTPKIGLFHSNLYFPWMERYPKICLSNMVDIGYPRKCKMMTR